MTKVIDIVNYLTKRFPLTDASNFDVGKVGLQFGSKNAEVKKVMIALDGTSEVVSEALKEGATMLITHHPFLFNPLLNLDYDSVLGKKMLNVFENHLNIFSMHTNFDVGIGGMNDLIATKLGLMDIQELPHLHQSESFVRLGRVEGVTLKEFALKVKEVLHEDGIRIVGPVDKLIHKVGLCAGGGALYFYDAQRAGCDCFITGEVRHNNAIDATENGCCIIEVSHSVESNFKEYILHDLQNEFQEVEFILSKKDLNPFHVL